MARARNIKPGFFRNEDLVELPFSTRLLFIGLWTLADREGRQEDRPKRIKMEVFPADDVDVDAGLRELHDKGLVVRYEVGGQRYIAIPTFSKHQAPHCKEGPSTIPAPGEHSASTVQAQCKHSASTRLGDDVHPLNPESGILNPESGILNPGGITHGIGGCTSPAPDDPPLSACADPPDIGQPTPAGAVCGAIRAMGVPDANPSHPTLLALIAAGASAEEFAGAAAEAIRKGKPSFAYVVGIVKRRREEAAKLVLHQGRMPNKQEAIEDANRAATAGWVPPELRRTTA